MSVGLVRRRHCVVASVTLFSLCLLFSMGSLSHAAAQPLAARAPFTPLPSGARFALLPAQSALSQAAPASTASRDDAARAVTTALRKRGYQVMSQEEVGKALSERLPDGCRDAATCDPKLALQALGVDAVVSLALWQRPNNAADLVVFVQRHSNYGQAELALPAGSDANIDVVAAQAVGKALEDTLARHEVTVRIESDPPGASVHVDQSLAGKSPVTLELAPGNHLLIVETPGYVTDAHYVDIPHNDGEVFVHRVQLSQPSAAMVSADGGAARSAKPASAVDADSPAPSSRVSATNYVLAAVLGAVAVPLLINAVYAGARDGDCTGKRDPQGRCSARTAVGAGFWASLGIGVAAGLGAGAVLVFTPFTDSEASSASGASLQLRTRF